MFKLKLSPWTFIENVVEDILLESFYEIQINLYIIIVGKAVLVRSLNFIVKRIHKFHHVADRNDSNVDECIGGQKDALIILYMFL